MLLEAAGKMNDIPGVISQTMLLGIACLGVHPHRRAFVEYKKSCRNSQMALGFTICRVTFSNGAWTGLIRITMSIARKKILRDQRAALLAFYAAAAGSPRKSSPGQLA